MSRLSRRPARRSSLHNRRAFLESLETRCVMATGDLDATFGNGGRVTADFGDFTPFVGSSDEAYTVEVQSDNKIVVAGSSGLFGPSQGTMARYLPNGTLDPNFGIGGRVSTGLLTSINDIYLLPSGKILAVGPTTTSTPSGTVDFGIIQYLPDGQVDEDGFGSRGVVAVHLSGVDIANAVTVSGGKILVAGSSGGGADFAVIRLSAGGNLDNTFDADGRQTVDFGSADESAADIGVDSAGNIVLVGHAATGVGATRDYALARLDTNGTLDATFNLDGRVTTDFNQDRNDAAKSLVIQAGDNYVVGGTSVQAKMFGTDDDFSLARYATNGDLLGGFDGDGKRTIDFTRDTTQPSTDQLGQIKATPSGQIVAVGRAWEPATRQDVAMVRLDGVTGVIDASLDLANGGLLFPQFWGLGGNAANAVALAPTGYILAGITGAFPANYGLLSISTTGTPVAGFGNNGRVVGDFTEFVGTIDLGEALAVQADGKTIVGGSVTGLSGPFGALARYNVNGTLDTTFGNGGRLVIPALDVVRDLVVLSSGKIVAVGGSSNMTAVQLLSDGTLDINNFGAQGVATIVFPAVSVGRAIAVQGNKLVIVGDVATGGGDFGAARLTAAGNLDPTFDVDGRLTVSFGAGADSAQDVVIDSANRVLMVGSATDTGFGTTDFALARVDNSGVLDATFNTDGRVTTDFFQNRNDVAVSVALQGANIVVGGWADQLKVVPPTDLDFALARYSVNGDLLLGFGTGGKVTTDFTRDTTAPSLDTIGEIAVDASNNVVAVGRSWETVFGGRQKAAAARYNGVTGAIDTTLNPVTGGRLYPVFYGMGPDQLNALAIASNGDWITAGRTGFGANFGVLRLNSSGVPVVSFAANGRQVTDFTSFLGSDDEARAVVNQPGGKTLVAGFATGLAGTQAAFVRYLADGTLDPSFGIGGRITTSLINGATDIVLSGGKILAVGPTTFGPLGTGINFGIIQLNDDGSLDQLNFGSRGITAIDFVGLTDSPEGVTVDDLGRIVVGGWSQVSVIPVDFDFSALRLTPSGNLDPTFDNDGRVLVAFGSLNDRAYDVHLDSQGRVVLAGSAAVGVGSTLDFALARLEDTGVLDATFNIDGLVTTEFGQNRDNEIRRIAIEADDKIIAGGWASLQKVAPVAPDDDFALARYGVNGDLLGGFGNGGKQTTDFTRVTTTPSTDRIGDLKLTGDGSEVVVVGWSWETTPARRDVAVASYNTTTGAIDTTINPSTGGRLYPPYYGVSSDMGNALAIDANGDWIIAGRTNDITGNFGVQKLDGDGTTIIVPPAAPEMAFELVIRDGSNAIITPNGLGQYVLGPGESFTVEVWVDDRRASGASGGVSAGYVDLSYVADLADWTSATITYGSSYPNSRRGSINEGLGRIEDAGGFGNSAPLGADPDRLLFSVQGKVKNSAADGSTFVLSTDPGDGPSDQSLMYGYGGPVPIANTLYSTATVLVTAGWSNAALAGDVNNDGLVNNLDVQLIYDELNSGNAPRALTGPPDAFYGDPNPTPSIPGSARYWDVDGNGVLNGLDAAQIFVLMGPLTLAAPAPTAGAPKSITVEEAQAAVDGVIARLEAAGASAEILATLKGASVSVSNLPAGLLGWAGGNSIVFDDDASGQGWFVDSTPEDDAEFVNGQAVDALFATGAVDLLTVAAHELGHLAGLEHGDEGDSDDVMGETLEVETRKAPEGLLRR